VDTKERLIVAMKELLWERGYAATSPRAVLDRAGVGQGSMYHHFADKADLAATALNSSGHDLRAAGEEVLDAPGESIERIAAYLHRERDVLKGCRIGRMTSDPDVLASEALLNPVRETLGWYQLRVAELLREGQQTGELVGTFSASAVAATVVATLQGAYVLAKAAGEVTPYEQAIEGVLQLLDTQRRPSTSDSTDTTEAGPERTHP
jgi:TetR/AcrR family transcriptional repressor of nem operon